jgi:hypothetical protein
MILWLYGGAHPPLFFIQAADVAVKEVFVGEAIIRHATVAILAMLSKKIPF